MFRPGRRALYDTDGRETGVLVGWITHNSSTREITGLRAAATRWRQRVDGDDHWRDATPPMPIVPLDVEYEVPTDRLSAGGMAFLPMAFGNSNSSPATVVSFSGWGKRGGSYRLAQGCWITDVKVQADGFREHVLTTQLVWNGDDPLSLRFVDGPDPDQWAGR